MTGIAPGSSVIDRLRDLLAEGRTDEAVELYEERGMRIGRDLLEIARGLSPGLQQRYAEMFVRARDFRNGAAATPGAGTTFHGKTPIVDSGRAGQSPNGGSFRAAFGATNNENDLLSQDARFTSWWTSKPTTFFVDDASATFTVPEGVTRLDVSYLLPGRPCVGKEESILLSEEAGVEILAASSSIRTAFNLGDIESALGFVTAGRREKYRRILQYRQADLASLSAEMGTLEWLAEQDGSIIYEAARTEEHAGVMEDAFDNLHFRFDADGRLRLEKF